MATALRKLGRTVSICRRSFSTVPGQERTHEWEAHDLFSAINQALRRALETDPRIIAPADTVFTSQIVNEAAEFRYISGNQFNGGAVGHGAHYLSLSPESFFCHAPGIKWLYRQAVEEIPGYDYMLPFSEAEVICQGSDITLVGWGAQLPVMEDACVVAAKEGISCELIDLKSLVPWHKKTVKASEKNRTIPCEYKVYGMLEYYKA